MLFEVRCTGVYRHAEQSRAVLGHIFTRSCPDDSDLAILLRDLGSQIQQASAQQGAGSSTSKMPAVMLTYPLLRRVVSEDDAAYMRKAGAACAHMKQDVIWRVVVDAVFGHNRLSTPVDIVRPPEHARDIAAGVEIIIMYQYAPAPAAPAASTSAVASNAASSSVSPARATVARPRPQLRVPGNSVQRPKKN